MKGLEPLFMVQEYVSPASGNVPAHVDFQFHVPLDPNWDTDSKIDKATSCTRVYHCNAVSVEGSVRCPDRNS